MNELDEGTDKKKRILEHYENVLSGFTNKEKEHLEALEQLEDYEGKLAEAHEKLEKSRVTIEELQEIIAEFNSEIGKYEEKIKKLEEIQAKLTEDFNHHIEKKNDKIKALTSELSELKIMKPEFFSENFQKIPDEVPENLNKESLLTDNLAEFLEKNLKNSSENLSQSFDLLFKEFFISETDPILKNSDQKLVLMNKIKKECENIQSIYQKFLNFKELYTSQSKELEELKTFFQSLQQKTELLSSENQKLQTSYEKLQQTNEILTKNLLDSDFPNRFSLSSEEAILFDSLGLDKQASIIQTNENENLIKIKVLEEENSRLKEDLETLKESCSSLQYSLSEENLKSLNSEEILKSPTKKAKNTPEPRIKPVVTYNENILILDHDSSSDNDQIILYREIENSENEICSIDEN